MSYTKKYLMELVFLFIGRLEDFWMEKKNEEYLLLLKLRSHLVPVSVLVFEFLLIETGKKDKK